LDVEEIHITLLSVRQSTVLQVAAYN